MDEFPMNWMIQAGGKRRSAGGTGRPTSSFLPAPCPLLPAAAGFTIIEAVVAVGVFLILLGTVMGIFVTFTRQQRFGVTQATLQGESQRFFETLEREVRTGFGSTFWCTGEPLPPPPGSGYCRSSSAFVLKNQNLEDVTYRYDELDQRVTRNGVPLTGPTIDVPFVQFDVARSGVDQGIPPQQVPMLTLPQGQVTVQMTACPKGVFPDSGRCLNLQTTLTSRQYAPPPS